MKWFVFAKSSFRCCPWDGQSRGSGSLTLGGVRLLLSFAFLLQQYCQSFCFIFPVWRGFASTTLFFLASAANFFSLWPLFFPRFGRKLRIKANMQRCNSFVRVSSMLWHLICCVRVCLADFVPFLGLLCARVFCEVQVFLCACALRAWFHFWVLYYSIWVLFVRASLSRNSPPFPFNSPSQTLKQYLLNLKPPGPFL